MPVCGNYLFFELPKKIVLNPKDGSITIEKNGSYVTEINGFTQGDYTDTTGWVFTVNGEMPDVGPGEITVEEGDKIAWNFIDFSTYPW